MLVVIISSFWYWDGWDLYLREESMTLREFIKLSAFVLIAAGTLGLLLNEFIWNTPSSRTIIFAVVDFVGLVNLSFAHFGMKKSKSE